MNEATSAPMTMTEILAISNAWPLWVLCAILVVWVTIQAYLFVRLCYKEARRIKYPEENLGKAIRVGMVTAIGPAIAGVVVMISMMAVIGGPITWQRLSIIGAAQTELTAANIAAQAMGTELGGGGFTVTTLALCFLVMAINGCGWLAMTAIATPSMETVRHKLSGGDVAWLGLLSAGATIGLFANFAGGGIVAGGGRLAAVIGGFCTQLVIDHVIAPKAPWIKGYAIAIALIVGIIIAYTVAPV